MLSITHDTGRTQQTIFAAGNSSASAGSRAHQMRLVSKITVAGSAAW